MFKLDLKRLILLLTLLSATLTFLNGFQASYRTLREQLMTQTLEANRVYAQKLADIADLYFRTAQQQLAFSAEALAGNFADRQRMNEEIRRFGRLGNGFNAVLVVREDGIVLAASPEAGAQVGAPVQSEGARTALAQRMPLLSTPYLDSDAHYTVFLSHPIFDAGHRYLGYVGGALYLHERNVLHMLLGNHHYSDGSYLYVVDGTGRLLYHQRPERIGERVDSNPVVQAVMRGGSGAQRVVNTQGVDMLAGYATVPSTGWGIIAQRPVAVTLEELTSLAARIVRDSIPFTVLSLLLFWFVASAVSRPLRQLSSCARELDAPDAPARISQIRTWFHEADRLKHAMLAGSYLFHSKLGKLNQENITDHLTGLVNRRGMELALESWQSLSLPFAVLAIDADHFKSINDTFGHDMGDRVLCFLAEKMADSCRSGDLLCRSGGEEFIALLPGPGLEEAQQIAERLCDIIAHAPSPLGTPVTVSIGVAHYPTSASDVAQVLKQADQALYAAKRNGRNQVVAAAA